MVFNHSAAIAAMLPKVEGKPRAMVALAQQMLTAGDRAGAARLCLRAIDDPSCPPAARVLATGLLSEEIPRWHFLIVRDQARNSAYEAALRRAIVPGCKVLEIGAGTGLLAMMAARAGADVVTCEADPVVALAAERVIARNGLADRVRVVAKHSTDLDAVADLGGRADILVSEIVSNDLLGEAALPAIEHAVRHLLKPEAAVIPARGVVRVALAEYLGPSALLESAVAGFELADFNWLAKPFREFGIGDPNIALHSEPYDLFSFDFGAGVYSPAQETRVLIESGGGTIKGTIQWIALEMDGETRYENRPAPGARSCWGAVFRPFDRAIETIAGEAVALGARHDRLGLSVWDRPET